MQRQLPKHAQAIIIGGGIHGCSVAYHLAREGWTDVVLLERKQLTCGTTWHAAGLVGQLQGSHATTTFAKYGIEIIQDIERETDQNIGFKKSGSISIAANEGRWAELKRKADFASIFGVNAYQMTKDEIVESWPLINPDGLFGGVHLPSDGSVNPVDLTMALAKGARLRGAELYEGIKVLDVLIEANKVVGVVTDVGTISSNIVVNCAGMWARELGQKNGIEVPLHACEHYYLVTEPIVNLPSDLPILRSYCDGTYWKEDAGKLLFGFAHFHARPWGTKGIPETFCFDSLPFIEEDVMEVLELAIQRVPLLQNTGIRTFFNGPESYSYDGHFTLGKAPDIKGYFILAGVNSTGIQSGSGAGKALADWIINGFPPMDLSEMDPARCEEFQARDPYLRERCPETLVLTYAMHWPGRQRETVRNLRRTPFYHALKGLGACYSEVHGWERPSWFAPKLVAPLHEYSFGRASWFNYMLEEQKAVRNAVAVIDYSMLGKLMVEGRDAETFLQRVCSNDMALNVGELTYSLMLNDRGGIESDITVARHSEDAFMVMSSIARTRRDRAHLQHQIKNSDDVRLIDVTTNWRVLSVCGPHSRNLMAVVSDVDMSNRMFPFNSLQQFYIGHAKVFAQRLSFTGELGWEIFVTPDFAEYVFDLLIVAGKDFGLQLVGGEALNALRIEKGFAHWGREMSYNEAPHQIGLEFACKANKNTDFVGRKNFLLRKAEASGPFICSVKLHDAEPLLHSNEPVLKEGKVVGYITSGAFSYHAGVAIGLALISPALGVVGKGNLKTGNYAVLVEGKTYPADLSVTSFYDPKNLKMIG